MERRDQSVATRDERATAPQARGASEEARERSAGSGAERPDAERPQGASESYGVCYTPDEKISLDRRGRKFLRRHTAQRWVYDAFERGVKAQHDRGLRDDEISARLPREFWCGHKLKDRSEVEIRKGESGKAHYSGVQYCGSVWRCPTCSAIIRNVRAGEVEQGVETWQQRGGGLYLLTMTIRHHRGDDLREMLDVLSTAWRRTVSGASWRKIRSELGIVGYVRSLEITHGRNGFHPHYHFLLFAEEPGTVERAREIEAAVLERWVRFVGEFGGKLPNGHGCDCRSVDDRGRIAADYVAKIAGEEGIAQEMARADLKESDEHASMTPFQFLDINTPETRRLWEVYCEATKGKRSVFFSRGLREILGLQAEKSDDEIVADLENRGDLAAVIDGGLYEDAVSEKPRAVGGVLQRVEAGDFKGAARLLGGVAEVTERGDRFTGEIVRCCIIRPG